MGSLTVVLEKLARWTIAGLSAQLKPSIRRVCLAAQALTQAVLRHGCMKIFLIMYLMMKCMPLQMVLATSVMQVSP